MGKPNPSRRQCVQMRGLGASRRAALEGGMFGCRAKARRYGLRAIATQVVRACSVQSDEQDVGVTRRGGRGTRSLVSMAASRENRQKAQSAGNRTPQLPDSKNPKVR